MLKRVFLSLTFILSLGLVLLAALVASLPSQIAKAGPIAAVHSPAPTGFDPASLPFVQTSSTSTRSLRINLDGTPVEYVDDHLSSGDFPLAGTFGGNCLNPVGFVQLFNAYS